MKSLLALGLLTIGLSSSSLSLAAPLTVAQALKPLEKKAFRLSIGVTRVRGSTPRDMLRDYAERVKGFEEGYRIVMRATASDIPEADDGQEALGLARIVDVASLISNAPAGSDDRDAGRRERAVQQILFDAREAGGLIGFESGSWNACGVTFPGAIVLDPKRKVIYTFGPDDTTC